MHKILLVDIENTVLNTFESQIKLLNQYAKKLNLNLPKETITNCEFYRFYKLFNHNFSRLSWLNRNLFYLKNMNHLSNFEKKEFNEALNDDTNLFLIQEIKDVQQAEMYNVVFSFWNSRSMKFMRSKDFFRKHKLDVNLKSSYKWDLRNGFNPNRMINFFAQKGIAMSDVAFLSNDVALMRYMHATGAKVISIATEENSLQNKIADTVIHDLFTTSLIDTLNKLFFED